MQGLLKLLGKKIKIGGTIVPDPDIQQVEEPDRVVIPLDYPGHIHYLPVVEIGDSVRKGQVIGKSRIGNCAFATISGTIKDITSVWTAQSVHSPAVVIEQNGEAPLSPQEIFGDPVPLFDAKAALNRIRLAGVNAPWTLSGRDYREGEISKLPPIEKVVITGVDEEPTIFKSQLLLEQNSQRVLEGLKKVNTLLPNAQVWLTVPGHMEDWAKEQFSEYAEILPLAQSYRVRIHREVIAYITGKRVSIRDSYIKHGIAVQDVEYLLAMLDALDGSSPFLQKYLTISGSGLEKAITVRFPLGSSLKHVLTSQGLEVSDYTRPVVGGPMKGIAQYSELTPLTHNDGIYLIKEDVAPSDLIAPCINCGRCARICPAKIQVHLVNRMIEFGQTESAKSLHSEACHECGLCGHVCPAERPIVQLIRFCNSDMVLGARHTWEAGGQK